MMLSSTEGFVWLGVALYVVQFEQGLGLNWVPVGGH